MTEYIISILTMIGTFTVLKLFEIRPLKKEIKDLNKKIDSDTWSFELLYDDYQEIYSENEKLKEHNKQLQKLVSGYVIEELEKAKKKMLRENKKLKTMYKLKVKKNK